MSERKVLVATCTCGEPVRVPIKKLGQILASERKTKPTVEHMRRISALGVAARKEYVRLPETQYMTGEEELSEPKQGEPDFDERI